MIHRKISRFALLWGPPITLMVLLFAASAQPKFDPPPELPVNSIYFSRFMPIFPGLMDLVIKKSAHFVVYGVLGLLMLRGVRAGDMPWRKAARAAVGLAASYAILDELHQAFVPGRHPSLMDIGIDIFGASLFILALWWVAGRAKEQPPVLQQKTAPQPEVAASSSPAK